MHKIKFKKKDINMTTAASSEDCVAIRCESHRHYWLIMTLRRKSNSNKEREEQRKFNVIQNSFSKTL